MYDHFALRGCSLKNTDFVIGLVTYVGPNTRIMLNSCASKQKQSNLERQTGRQILYVFLTMCICCACAASFVVVWDRVNDSSTWYLDMPDPSNWGAWTITKLFLQSFGTWILLFTNMVPISLLVSLEIVKFSQAKFIGWDWQIYSEEKDLPTKVQSSNLNEELG